jgi:hypothetical protein
MNSVIVNLKAVVQLGYCVDARSRSRKGRLVVELRRWWEVAGAFWEDSAVLIGVGHES